MSKLRDRLERSLVENHETKWYLPEPRLNAILDEKTISDVIKSKIMPQYQDEVRKAVLAGGKKIFAILIMIGKEQDIVRFIQNDHMQDQPLDAKLPFNKDNLVHILGETNGNLFHRKQWSVLAPRIRGDASHRDFDLGTILPITENKKIGSGGFSTVYEIKLNPEHHGDPLSLLLPVVIPRQSPHLYVVYKTHILQDLTLIRKKLDHPSGKRDMESLASEIHILSQLRLVKHPSIVRLITSYVYRGTYNLIFERAECDLEALLRSPSRTVALATDDSFYQALQGLCSAVASFHHVTSVEYGLELKGYHHDLKPQNILVHGTRFLLSDFGLSSLKSMSANSKTLSRDVQGFYIPPESGVIYDGFERKKVGQPSDIWALGCILAVVVTYMVKGSEGVAQFEQKRKHTLYTWTTYTFHHAGEKNPAVYEWLEEIGINSTPEARGLISLVRDILQLDPNQRPSAKDISSRMDFIAAKSRFGVLSIKFAELEKKAKDSVVSDGFKRFTLFGEAIGFNKNNLAWTDLPLTAKQGNTYDLLQGHLIGLETYLDYDMKAVRSSTLPRGVRDGIHESLDSLDSLLSGTRK
ncbi:Cyclin-dependent kinase 3 [Daldinia childiae]|uniref:Cyclin-dependent kinase 3 n=1 Tax=Daldinia childiae TaxID=326645 RepID=UPI0014470C1B|nr:Cyclin-dependent kinase 3 [Daldinia childiae]KAF3059824.1 Cyclin-dependent kinase 3 [Daldinia childiae]